MTAPSAPVPSVATPETETLSDFAKRIGVHKSTITRAAQAGRLALSPEGRVMVAASLARWHATRGGRDDVAARHAQARGHAVPHPYPYLTPEIAPAGRADPAAGLLHAAATAATAAAAHSDDDDATAGPVRLGYQVARETWRNALMRLEMDLATGAQIDRQAAIQEAASLGGLLRAAVDRLIDQTAPRLAAAADNPAERRRLLQAQLAQVRRQMRREPPQALRRLRPAGVPTRAGGAA